MVAVAKRKRSRSKRTGPGVLGTGARLALLCLGIVLCVVLLLSCLSFDIGDAPSTYRYPANDPALNWCGSMGAFAAFYLLYYMGPGVFIVLISLICYLGAKLVSRPLDQIVFRSLGLILLTVAASCTFHFFWPRKVFL